SSRARKVADCLATHGASFFDELLDATGLLRTELEDALAELVARGMAHCDSFAGLRALLVPPSKRTSPGRGRRRGAPNAIEDAGRWALVRRPAAAEDGGRRRPDPEAVEHVARVLLRRYGVVGWRILEREAAWLPQWRELLRVYHRLEARGEVRGGRFIEGLSGEQFALPEAIAPLRKVRNRPPDGQLVEVSALDPLNLSGTVMAGDKVPRIGGARLLFRDGVPVAARVAGEVRLLAALEPAVEQEVRRRLSGEPESGLEALLARIQANLPQPTR